MEDMDNKSSAWGMIAVAVIVAIIGPIIVWYVTSSDAKSEQQELKVTMAALQSIIVEKEQQTPERIEIVVTSPPEQIEVVITATPTNIPPGPTSTSTPVPPTASPTPFPSEFSAGTPIVYDGLELVINSTLKHYSKNRFGFEGVLKNNSGKQKLIRFTYGSFKFIDDLGNDHYQQNDDFEDMVESRQIAIDSGNSIPFWASETTTGVWNNHHFAIRVFKGEIPPQAKQLILKIDDFGSFPPLTIIFDL